MDLIRNFEYIYTKFQQHKETPVKQDKPGNSEGKKDIIDQILGEDDGAQVTIFANAEEAKTLASSIIEKIADVKAENKEKTDSEAIYESVSAALRELQGLSIDNETAKIESIKNKLDQIQKACTMLQEQIRSFEI
jgi:hypothetical protein